MELDEYLKMLADSLKRLTKVVESMNEVQRELLLRVIELERKVSGATDTPPRPS